MSLDTSHIARGCAVNFLVFLVAKRDFSWEPWNTLWSTAMWAVMSSYREVEMLIFTKQNDLIMSNLYDLSDIFIKQQEKSNEA